MLNGGAAFLHAKCMESKQQAKLILIKIPAKLNETKGTTTVGAFNFLN